MKSTKIFILIFSLCIVFSGVTLAKSHSVMDMSNPSVQLLKQLNDNGAEIRKNDIPIEKPDVSGDISRADAKKQEFYDAKSEAFPSLYPKIETPSDSDILEVNDTIKEVVETK